MKRKNGLKNWTQRRNKKTHEWTKKKKFFRNME